MFAARFPSLLTLLCIAGSSLSALSAGEPDDDAPVADEAHVADDAWSGSGWPLIQKYCLDCHNEDFQEGELDLTTFRSLGKLRGSGGASMQRVLEMARFGAMPPEDAEQPSTEERKQLVLALDQAMYAVSCDLRPRPGKVTARRLNRAEFNRTIADLFGLELNPSDAFPSDEVGAGFDNNGDVLSLSTLLMEKYLDVAEEIASQALIDPDTLPRIDKDRASDQLLVHGESKTGRFNGRFIAEDAFVFAEFEIPFDGEYHVRVRGGNTSRKAEPTDVAVYDQNGRVVEIDDLEYYGGGGSSRGFDFWVDLKAGTQHLFVQPISKDEKSEMKEGETISERFANIDETLIAEAVKRRKTIPLNPTSNIDDDEFPFMVRSVGIWGPKSHPDEMFPPSQDEILRRRAKKRGDRWREVEESAMECLKPLMRRAFRSPVSEDEVRPYVKLVKDATERGDSYYRGLQIAVSAILVSPRFLFRVETPAEDAKPDDEGAMQLTQHQLATRLSYFLWSSMPDEQLLAEADRGELKEGKLEHHVRRMIADERAESLATQFASQWLGLRNLDVHEADTETFESFTPSLRKAMMRETETLFLHMVRENRPVADLLTADFTFVNGELAKHYGIENQGLIDEEFVRVSLDPTPRRGILSHASVLTLSSNPTRTSPVKRGKWILQNVLGTPPPDPPAGVPELEETKTAEEGASLRKQLEVHRADPTCAACHRVMDQLGFGLEQFDAIGQFRERDGGQPIDASGELPGGRVFAGAGELSDILGKTESEAFARTAVERMMTFALGRELSPTDRCTVDEIVAKSADQQHRWIDLVMAVVRSRPFQFYDWETP